MKKLVPAFLIILCFVIFPIITNAESSTYSINLPSNVTAGGQLTFDGTTIYYSADGITKIENGETVFHIEESGSLLQVYDGYLYFVNNNALKRASATDGSRLSLIEEGVSDRGGIGIYEGWIYYITNSGSIVRTNLTTFDREVIVGTDIYTDCERMLIADGFLFYEYVSISSPLYKINLNTFETTKVLDQNAWWFTVYNDYLYFESSYANGDLFRCDLDGRGQSRLIPSSSIPENGFGREGINFVGDVIYIYNSSRETVDRYTMDGTHINSESIYDCYDVVAIGNRIYARYYIEPTAEERSSGLQLEMFDNRNRLTLSYNVVAGIFEDNTVGWATTSNFDFDTDSWNDIISVQAGLSYLFGLKSDGTVVITGDYNDGSGPRGIMSSGMDMFGTHYNEWTDVVQIACAKGNLFGLKKDGSLVAFGPDIKWQAPLYFDEWTNLVKITASDDTIVGLKADGTVVAAGGNEKGQCGTGMITNAKDVVATTTCTIVLLEDGTLQTVGELSNDDTIQYIFDGVELQDGDECFTIVDGYGGRWVIDRYSFNQHDYDTLFPNAVEIHTYSDTSVAVDAEGYCDAINSGSSGFSERTMQYIRQWKLTPFTGYVYDGTYESHEDGGYDDYDDYGEGSRSEAITNIAQNIADRFNNGIEWASFSLWDISDQEDLDEGAPLYRLSYSGSFSGEVDVYGQYENGSIDIWSVSIYMNDPKDDAAAAANLYALGMNIFYNVERYSTEEDIRGEIAYSSGWENRDMYFSSDDGYPVTINLGVLPNGEWDGQMWSGL